MHRCIQFGVFRLGLSHNLVGMRRDLRRVWMFAPSFAGQFFHFPGFVSLLGGDCCIHFSEDCAERIFWKFRRQIDPLLQLFRREIFALVTPGNVVVRTFSFLAADMNQCKWS